MKNLFKILFAAGLLALGSCEYLEYDEDKAWTDELVWSEYSYVRQYVTDIYLQMPSKFAYVDGAFLAASTDDAEHSNLSSDVERFNSGSLTMFNHPNTAWGKNYEGIRLANTFIKAADTITFSKYKYHKDYAVYLQELEEWKGEARFLKAYYYFELAKRYGSVPIVNEWNDDMIPVDPTPKTFNEVVDYIAVLCDSALYYLPAKAEQTSPDVDLGRINKEAAYALKCRAYLYAASELHNPSGAYNAYYDSCAVNASKLFSTCGLVNFADLFTPGSSVMKSNNEVILDIRSGGSNSLEKNNYPVGFYNAKGYTNPTQDLVDAFEMKDGTAFDWNNPAHAADPYSNRDSRLSNTVVYNGMVMGATADLGADSARAVQIWNGGVDGPIQKHIYGTRTGYYLKKYIKTNWALADAPTTKHYWYLFRYAEILLNYAEAMDALYGADSDPNNYGKTAREALNEVRVRAGQPAYADVDATLFSQKIRNERRVELAFEDHRHWDVRRWNIGEQVFNTPIHGVDIERVVAADSTVSFTYTVKEVEERVFENFMNLYPLPSDEVLGGINLPQNPGWE